MMINVIPIWYDASYVNNTNDKIRETYSGSNVGSDANIYAGRDFKLT